MESVLPQLAYGNGCASTIELRNLAEAAVDVELEAHRTSGAVVALAGHAGRVIHLAAGAQGSYQLQIPETETEAGAWVRVRERTASPQVAPAVAISGNTECRQGEQLRTVPREVAYAMRNPWFTTEMDTMRGAIVEVLNLTGAAVPVSVCRGAGSLYSVPGETQSSRELRPVCSIAFEAQVPPFGTRLFPVETPGTSYFSLKTRGDSVVLELLRPAPMGVRTYTVDSTIKFGGEVPAARR